MDIAMPHLPDHQHGQLISQPSQSHNIVDIPDLDPDNNAVGIAISKLEDILANVQEALWDRQELSIPYRTRSRARQTSNNPGGNPRLRPATSAVRFPGRTDNEAIKFTRLLKICQLSLSALIAGTPITKRNIYYQDPVLFKNMSVVDKLVDDLAYTLGLGRDSLNIASTPSYRFCVFSKPSQVAAAKGLIAGPLILHLKDSSRVDASSSDTGVLLPLTKSLARIDFRLVEWVLVIEKEVGVFSPCVGMISLS
nr:Meiotic recombination protein rec12 [Colletotrichum truncatum]KAF6790650.1 Meiotic recombination protein rec12 [Colletotrichum truncatum]